LKALPVVMQGHVSMARDMAGVVRPRRAMD
jgi:hypothetical protein